MKKIGIIGISGKMGTELVNVLIHEASLNNCMISGGSFRAHCPSNFKEVIHCTDEYEALIADSDIIIDFTSPSHSVLVAQAASEHKTVHICGTTGFSDTELYQLEELAKETVIFYSPNMSIAVNMLATLVEQASSMLDDSYDIEILEAHHKYKVDAPSGTALMLGKAVATAKNLNFNDVKVTDRANSDSLREPGSIGFSSIRGGNIVGEHSVFFISPNEKLTLSHTMYNRKIYAENAFKIAYWAASLQPEKLYSMKDYLNQSKIKGL
jgi:4-hydroxy-tetrahydrodipicolinate reductase